MRATMIGLGALLLIVATASVAQANPYGYGPPQAPDACGPGYYVTNPWGMTYGPNHWLTPPSLPWNGLLPAPQQGGSAAFPRHPYARSPRDFFMIYDNWYDIPYPRSW